MLFAPADFRPPKLGAKPPGAPRIYELMRGQCKYPIDFVDGEHRFCAAERQRSSPYCAEHHALCNGQRREAAE
jgi:hypothetical protein